MFEGDQLPSPFTTLEYLKRAEAVDAACGQLYAVADVLHMPPLRPDQSVVIVAGLVPAGPISEDIEDELETEHAKRAPWLGAVLDLGAWVVGGALAMQINNISRAAPNDYNLCAADPEAVAPAVGAAVAEALRKARPDKVVEVTMHETPDSYAWVATSGGARLRSRDESYEYMYRYPVVRLSRTTHATVADSLRAEWLAPAALAWTRDGLEFSAAAARHYRNGFSLLPPAIGRLSDLRRVVRYSEETAFAVPSNSLRVSAPGASLFARVSHSGATAMFEAPDDWLGDAGEREYGEPVEYVPASGP